VGGWDGKKRTTEVWTFDVNANEWTLLNPDPTSSPPAGEQIRCYHFTQHFAGSFC